MDYKIPQATLDRLNAPQTEGSRHANILAISLTLVGDGVPDQEIYQLLRNHYPPEKTDREIWDAIRGAHAKNPQPLQRQNVNLTYSPKPKTDQVTPEQALCNARQFLRGLGVSEREVSERSIVPISTLEKGCINLFENLYSEDEYVNIVCKFSQPEDKPNKANPYGPGLSKNRDGWLDYFKTEGIPQSRAGAWIRPNPCKERGTGKDGAYQDADITAFRFLLIESDCLPLDTQLPLLCSLRIPIAAIIYSGGSSYHAWVRVGCMDKSDFAVQAERIIGMLSRFGIDRSNKNPSRMARLPGASRIIGAQNGGEQRLVYLNPSPRPSPIL